MIEPGEALDLPFPLATDPDADTHGKDSEKEPR